ncbi:MAG: head-tail connector protein [Candidatus Xenobiia bacterium LiM19]
MGNLTTLSTLKGYLRIGVSENDDDAELQRLIRVASGQIEKYCGRKFDSAQHIETFTGNGRQLLYLTHRPVASVTSVVVDDSTDAATNYSITDEAALYRELGWVSGLAAQSGIVGDMPDPEHKGRNITVTYTAGYVLPGETGRTFPYDLEEACLQLCEYHFNHSPRNRGVQSENIGGYSAQYITPSLVPENALVLPAHIRMLLEPYKEVVI